MAESTAICPLCCTPPQIAGPASTLENRINNVATYAFASTFTQEKIVPKQAMYPGRQFQYKSEQERINALLGRITVTGR